MQNRVEWYSSPVELIRDCIDDSQAEIYLYVDWNQDTRSRYL